MNVDGAVVDDAVVMPFGSAIQCPCNLSGGGLGAVPALENQARERTIEFLAASGVMKTGTRQSVGAAIAYRLRSQECFGLNGFGSGGGREKQIRSCFPLMERIPQDILDRSFVSKQHQQPVHAKRKTRAWGQADFEGV